MTRAHAAVALTIALLAGALPACSANPAAPPMGDDGDDDGGCGDRSCELVSLQTLGTLTIDDAPLIIDQPYTNYIPHPTATGGTQMISLVWLTTMSDNDLSELSAFDGTYRATISNDGNGGDEIVSDDPQTIIISGAGSGTDTLTIQSSDSFIAPAMDVVAVAPVDAVALIPKTGEDLAVGAIPVFLPGDLIFGVALIDSDPAGPIRVVDTAMQLTGIANATQLAWDTLYIAATVGTQTLTIVAGNGAPRTLPITVVGAPDTLALRGAPIAIPGGYGESVCFDATAAGAPVVGLPWTFVIAAQGTIADQYPSPNCVNLLPATNPVVVQVTAGPLSGTFSFAVAPS